MFISWKSRWCFITLRGSFIYMGFLQIKPHRRRWCTVKDLNYIYTRERLWLLFCRYNLHWWESVWILVGDILFCHHRCAYLTAWGVNITQFSLNAISGGSSLSWKPWLLSSRRQDNTGSRGFPWNKGAERSMKSKGWAWYSQGSCWTWAQKCIFLTCHCFKVLDFELSPLKRSETSQAVQMYIKVRLSILKKDACQLLNVQINTSANAQKFSK